MFDWKEKKTKLKILFIFLFACTLWIYLTGPYIRYFIAIAPIGAILIAFSFEKMLGIFQVRLFRIVAWGTLGIILISNFVFMLGMYYVPNVYPWQSFKDQSFTTSMYTNVERVLEEAGKNFGKDSNGLLIESPALYFADTHIETIYWYHQKNYDEIIGSKLKGKELAEQIFGKMRFDYMVMPKVSKFEVFEDDDFTRNTKQIFEEGDFVLITINAEN